jgi:type I restriction enzyme S subunit
MKLKPYPEYKDSGVPWLGKIPKHWEVPRLGTVLRERGETNVDGRVTDVLSVLRDRGVIPYAEKGNIGNKKSDDITRYKVVRPDDIVVNCMNVIIGSVGLSRYTGCLSPVYYVLTRRSKTDDPRYLNAYFQTKPFQLSLVRIGNGILAHRMRIPMELLKCEPFPKPPSDEQAAIVRFLDYFDLRINHLIRAKRRLIELLNEQKQVIIHRAVTRGLDPNVRLKPSSIDWLGDVPEHWEVMKLARVARVSNGTTPSRMQPQYWQDGTIPWLSSGKVNDYIVREPSELVTERALRECSISLIPRGSVIMGMVGQGKTRGMSAFLDIDACINQNLAAIVPRQGLDGHFLHYVLTSFYKPIREYARGGNQEALNCEIISSLRVPFPTTEERNAIVRHLDQALGETLLAKQNAQREIDLLREYRTRLIADVVTGKLDVLGVIEAGNGPSSSSGTYPGLPDEELDDLDPGEDVEAEEIIDTEETTWNDR